MRRVTSASISASLWRWADIADSDGHEDDGDDVVTLYEKSFDQIAMPAPQHADGLAPVSHCCMGGLVLRADWSETKIQDLVLFSSLCAGAIWWSTGGQFWGALAECYCGRIGTGPGDCVHALGAAGRAGC